VFSMRSVPRFYKQDKLVRSQSVGELVNEVHNRWGSILVSCCCEKLVAKAGDSLGTQRKGNIHH
jgi:hypothetical protein